MMPPPSWESFDICDKCGTGAGKPCFNLKTSTSRKLRETTMPHKGRKQLWGSARDGWYPR